ncbi:MAG TPA: cytochrome c [Steroidobacteraceae bacterium]
MPPVIPRWVLGFGLAFALLVNLNAQAAGDPVRGKQLGYTCLGCHGIDSYKNVYPTYNVPRLRGQHPEYLAAALKEYRGKERSHLTMWAQGSSLSDQDIDDVAAYLAGEPLKPGSPTVGEAPAKVEALCGACHGKDGVGITPDYPTLAGQHVDYLMRALHEYQKGDRKNPVMATFVSTLTAADIQELAEYYGAQKPELKTVPRLVTIYSAR